MAEARSVLKQEEVSFSSDSQILSELGERLIGSRKVALGELVKNAYDADASQCNIWLEGDDSVLIIKDDGHGMTERAFRDYWMTIATPHRTRDPTSRRYNRDVTGSKGVGRFAVRNLGLKLELRSVAYYEEHDEYRRLVAGFDWDKYESGSEISEMTVEYRIEGDVTKKDEGTLLRISTLRKEWTQKEVEEVSGEVLDIISAPYESVLSQLTEETDNDPGFSVYFAPPGEESPTKSAAQEIYERYVGKVRISVKGTMVSYAIEYEDTEDRNYEFKLDENMVSEIEGEVRFLPNRSGVFRGLDTMDGRSARSWLSDNGGVRVIDRNFRMPPYGDKGNDWLSLSESEARRYTSWQSSITGEVLPEEKLEVSRSQAALRLPSKVQVLGAVRVSSYRPGEDIASAPTDRLVPAMDRQGFVDNEAFDQLVDITRGGLEILGAVDAEVQLKKKEEAAEESRSEARTRIRDVKRTIRDRDDVSEEAKQEINEELDKVADSVEEHHEAQQEARQAVESMNLLGAVSAFMSHETSLILDSANKMLDTWKGIPEKDRSSELEESIEITEQAVGDFKDHLSYSNLVMEQMAEGETKEFKPKYQVDFVIEKFESYSGKRQIEVENRIPNDIETPSVNLGLYSGIITNLYTNAMKAVLEKPVGKDGRRIVFEAENTGGKHKLRIIDNGVGIPEEEQSRIFDPLYSTTDIEGPGGPGTGLGLYIVDRVLNTVDGEIVLIEPPDGYSTAFEVRLNL